MNEDRCEKPSWINPEGEGGGIYHAIVGTLVQSLKSELAVGGTDAQVAVR